MGNGIGALVMGGVAGILTGCVTYKHPTSSYVQYRGDGFDVLREEAAMHLCYKIIPRKHEQLKWYDGRQATWALFGNDNDGIFGERKSPPYSTNITSETAVRWWVRNPMHNVSFGALKTSGCEKKYSWSLLYYDSGHTNKFHVLSKEAPNVTGDGKCTFALCFRGIRPFFELKIGRFETYLGQRKEGFGAKLRIRPKDGK